MKIVKVILPYIISFLICNVLYFLVGLRLLSLQLAMPVFFTAYLIIGLYWIRVEKNIWRNIGIPFWFFIALLIFGLFKNPKAVSSLLMPLIIPTLLGLWSAFFIKKYSKITASVAVLLSIGIVSYYDLYLLPKQNYIKHTQKNNREINLSILKSEDASFQDLNGKVVNLKNLNKKIVYAEFWFTTCKPCLDKMPAILRLKQEFKDNKDIIFISIVDGEIDNFEDFQKVSALYTKAFDLILFAPKETSIAIKKSMGFNSFPYEALFFNNNLYSSHLGFNSAESSYYLSERKETINKLLVL